MPFVILISLCCIFTRSLPRYKTRDIKGFAFVEFEKESEAKAALKVSYFRVNLEDKNELRKFEFLEFLHGEYQFCFEETT